MLIVTDSAAVNRANHPNQIMVICSDEQNRLVIADTRSDPAWADWWARYAGPTMVSVPEEPDQSDRIAELEATVAAQADQISALEQALGS